jgi:hypothetical protein
MGLASFVGPETTEPTTQTVGGSALGAADQDVGLNQDSLLNGTMGNISAEQMTMDPAYHAQLTQAQASLNTYNSIYYSTASISQPLYATAYNILPTMTNSSMNTKTNTEKPDASKPVTLTMTGQLKPNIIIKERPAKSSRSTKKLVNPSLYAIINNW